MTKRAKMKTFGPRVVTSLVTSGSPIPEHLNCADVESSFDMHGLRRLPTSTRPTKSGRALPRQPGAITRHFPNKCHFARESCMLWEIGNPSEATVTTPQIQQLRHVQNAYIRGVTCIVIRGKTFAHNVTCAVWRSAAIRLTVPLAVSCKALKGLKTRMLTGSRSCLSKWP